MNDVSRTTLAVQYTSISNVDFCLLFLFDDGQRSVVGLILVKLFVCLVLCAPLATDESFVESGDT